jgi:uncharacterized membrane protein
VTRFLEVVSVFVYVVDLVLTVVSVSPIKACYSGWMWLNLVLVTGMLTDQLACKVNLALAQSDKVLHKFT